MEKLTHQEEELLLIIFQQGKGFIKDFILQMEEPQPPYTTVASIVKNLENLNKQPLYYFLQLQSNYPIL